MKALRLHSDGSTELRDLFLFLFLGVFVVGAGDSGVLLEHRESEFGDHANMTAILDVVKSHAVAKTKL